MSNFFLSVKNKETHDKTKIKEKIQTNKVLNPICGITEERIVPESIGIKTAKINENIKINKRFRSGSWFWASLGNKDAKRSEKTTVRRPVKTAFPIKIVAIE